VEDFIVPFKGLGVGNHAFKFEIEDKFFESFEYFEGINGHLLVDVDLLREPNMMIFRFEISGKLNLICDRCLGDYSEDVKGNNKLIVKFGDKFLEESDDVIIIHVNESRIDLRQFIFEYINMLLPVRKIHPKDENGDSLCDEDIIDRIDKYSEPKADPRWDALKDLEI